MQYILFCYYSILQFTWHLTKKASQVIYLHFALKKRAIVEEFHEKQEQVTFWSSITIIFLIKFWCP